MASLAVLMSVYRGTDAGELAVCLQSLAAQTRPADEVVVMLDGQVSEAVMEVLAGFPARLVPLKHNVGLGKALNAGLETVDSEFVARLDSDDAAYPQRFERQLEYLAHHPEVAAVGSAVREFEHRIEDAGPVRALPENPRNYAKMNSPLNHPSVMFRADAVRQVGSYQHVPFMEDYDLWARLLSNGWELANLPEPLTYLRVNDAQLRRRAAGETRRAELTMQRNLVAYGLVSRPRAVFNFAVRNAYRMLPIGVTKRVYSRLFHRGQ